MVQSLMSFGILLMVGGFIGSYFDLRATNRRYDAHDRAIAEQRRKRELEDAQAR